jgi:hypothetical protein
VVDNYFVGICRHLAQTVLAFADTGAAHQINDLAWAPEQGVGKRQHSRHPARLADFT